MKTLLITYYPNNGILLNDINLHWGMDRETIRQLLNQSHKANDSIIDLSQFNNSNSAPDIVQKRDIYQNYEALDNYFFLNYDVEDLLEEIEIHNGPQIIVENIQLSFDKEISEILLDLKSICGDNEQLSPGEYLFADLKLTIADAEFMGMEGNTLAYFYCSKNIDHLLENNVSS